MEAFHSLEVLSSNGRVNFHWLEGTIFYLSILARLLILVLDAHGNSGKVRKLLRQLAYCSGRLFKITPAFQKLKYYDELIRWK